MVLPPIALGKADWKAAGAVEKALEGALGTDADLVSVSAAAAKDRKLGAKAIGCKGESPAGKLRAFGAQTARELDYWQRAQPEAGDGAGKSRWHRGGQVLRQSR